jgi:type IV fimbrial biogenesis protein FimT
MFSNAAKPLLHARRRSRGFTLMELMVTLALAAVLVGIAIPNLRTFILNNRLTSVVNDMLWAIQTARTEAIKRQQTVMFCATTDPAAVNPTCNLGAPGTPVGWILFVDFNNSWQRDAVVTEPVLARHDLLDPTIIIRGDSTGKASFNGTGFPNPALPGVAIRNVVLCDSRGNVAIGLNSTARALQVSATGRTRVSALKTDVDAALAAIPATCP